MSRRAVFLFFACLYLLALGRGFYSSDGEVMFKTSAALAKHGTFELAPDPGLPQIVRGQNGHYTSKYDPGLPLLGVPFYALGDWLAAINQAHRYRVAALFYLLIPALAAAGSLALLFGLARRLYGERRALMVALIAGTATLLVPYARMLFAEAVLAWALTGAVAVMLNPDLPRTGAASSAHGAIHVLPLPALSRRTIRYLIAGAVFGIGVLVRAAFGIYVLPLALPIAWDRREVVARRLVAFGLGALPGILLLIGHNALRFGDPFQFGYAGEGFTTPLYKGAWGLLFSREKSLFLYAPPLLLSVILWPRFRRMYPALAWSLALAWIAALIFYGAWWAWDGGWSWGPRFLVPLIPLSCLPLGMIPDRWAWRIMLAALVMLGIGAQLLGVVTDWIAYYEAGEPGSPLGYALRDLQHGHTEPLAMFHLADHGLPPSWVIGVPLLLIIGLGYAGIIHSATFRRARA